MTTATLDVTEARKLVEKSMGVLSAPERTIFSPHEIEPVLDNLIELWSMLNASELQGATPS